MFKINNKLKKQIYFVIPAYNEDKQVGKVLKDLFDSRYSNIILVDDGSIDDTRKQVQKFEKKRLILLSHIINRGQGAALKTGIDYALKNEDCKYIVTFDSDGQHRLSDLPNLIEPLEKGECNITLGSRFLDKKSKELVPFSKRILLKGALLVTHFLSRKWFTDTHNGYRVMNTKAAKNIKIEMDGFEHASEILDEIVRKQITYKEVPVYIDYSEYSKAKGQKISNSIKILIKMVFRG